MMDLFIVWRKILNDFGYVSLSIRNIYVYGDLRSGKLKLFL